MQDQSFASLKIAGPRKAAMAFIYVTVILDVLALGIIIPVFPQLVAGFSATTAQGAIIYGLFVTIWGLMQFLFSPLLGALSDRFGRRPVLILSGFGLGADYAIMAVAPNLAWLFVGRVLSGITSASYAAASAYVADVTPLERRAAAFGMIGVAWGIGFILGPALGGALGMIQPRLPFWVAAAFSISSASYGLLVLPESLRSRDPFSWKRANPVGSLKLLSSHRELLWLAAILVINFLGFQVLPTVYVLYAKYRFGWGPVLVGANLALVGICNIIVQGRLVRPFISRFGERITLSIGLLAGMAGYLVWGLANNEILFALAIPIFAPVGLAGPALQSLMSRRVKSSEQGQLQGANASIAGLTGIFGPTIFSAVFSLFIGPLSYADLPGAPFLLAAALLLGSLGVSIREARRAPESEAYELARSTESPPLFEE
jgi:DHA1 family tetracycline resistance protein-like MFS transporter